MGKGIFKCRFVKLENWGQEKPEVGDLVEAWVGRKGLTGFRVGRVEGDDTIFIDVAFKYDDITNDKWQAFV